MKDARWHIGAMNDAVFIIDRAPRPSTDDADHGADCRAISPAIDEHIATLIVEAHNETVDQLRARLVEVERERDEARGMLAAVRSRIENWDWRGLRADAHRGDYESIESALLDVVHVADAVLGPDPEMQKP